jgi:hypothetical protein
MKTHPNPAVLMADFIRTMTMKGVSEHMKAEAKPAVAELFSMPRNDANFKDNEFLRNVSRSLASRVKKPSKYRDIWDLNIFLDYIRNGPVSAKLCWNDLMARAAALSMVFIPLRPVGVWRIDPSTEKQSEGVDSIEVFTREKMDDLKGGSMVVIRALKDDKLCPLKIYRLLKKGAAKKGQTRCLWCSVSGKPFKSQDRICKLLKDLLLNTNIPSRFTAYSIRHAMITACCKFKPENQVNAYTGHSFNAHTVLQNYNHLDMMWAETD